MRSEIKAPYGYVLNNEPKEAELTYAGQEFEVRDTVDTEFENEYQRVMIRLSKTMENDELFGIGSNGSTKMFVSDCLPQKISQLQTAR